ncbi:cryptochrome/photolyase family protein, partial [Bacteriovoracales bacterium]|nr:cryptochrome/photolyase family protein [Bacteriovoracales bacterium]
RQLFYIRSMRSFCLNLNSKGYKVNHIKLKDHQEVQNKKDQCKLEEELKKVFIKKNIREVIFFEIENKTLESKIKKLIKKYKLKENIINSPMFLSSREEFKDYLDSVNKPLMGNFYIKQRKKFNILLDSKAKPIGGKWSLDLENRKKLPKNINFPPLNKFSISKDNGFYKDKALIQRLFPDSPGSLDDYWLPTDPKDAQSILNFFIQHKLENFGSYQDSLTTKNDFVFHSLLSPYLNIGLITPKDIIDKVLKSHKSKAFPLNSVEGFIRQIVGWREFIRGIYQNFDEEQKKSNFWGHEKVLQKCWYRGTTGILPVDDAIKKVLRLGYNHHIERLMVLSNFMLLCEINPHQVYRWFMEMYIDSSEWVMGPNVYGMGQFSDGGIFATKPYISGSNYILKMSDYSKGDWCPIWDALYWRFIHKKRKFYQKNHRMGFMVATLEKMDDKKRKNHFNIAKEFLKSIE